MRAVDRYGNTNASLNGSALISLAAAPATLGSDYCVDSSSMGRTACLDGTFESYLQNGFANFTNIFVKFSAPNFTLRFDVTLPESLILKAFTQRFHVLPHPPRISGLTFSSAFTHLILTFDSPTNLAEMKGSGNCAQLFGSLLVQAFSQTARCDWRDTTTVWILLGNNASVYPSDCLLFKDGVVIHSAVNWIRIPLTNGLMTNQLINTVEVINVDFQLISPNIPPPWCFPLSLPVKLELTSTFNSEMDETVSAVKHFSDNENDYFVIAKYCSGPRCRLDQSFAHTSANMEINTSVYLISNTNAQSLLKIQDIPTQGPVTLLLPKIYDTSINGGLDFRQFLVVVNSQQKAKRIEFALGAVDIYVWRDTGPVAGFEFRQEITFVNRPVHASTIDDDDGTLLAVATESDVVILRWIEGSFRASSSLPLPLGWFPGETFGWVHGQFLENIQSLPGEIPSFCHLHRVQNRPQDLFLAIADSSFGGRVKIFQWNRDGCILGCFMSEPLASLQAVAPRSISTFSSGGRDFLVIANFAEGSAALDQARHSLPMSFTQKPL